MREGDSGGFTKSPQNDRGGRHKPRNREEKRGNAASDRVPSHGCGMFMKPLSREPEEVMTGEPRE